MTCSDGNVNINTASKCSSFTGTLTDKLRLAARLSTSYLTHLWWAGLKRWWPEVSYPRRGRPQSAPRSSPGGAGHRPELISAAGSHLPAAAASAPDGKPGPPCPCYCWPIRCHLDRKERVCIKEEMISMIRCKQHGMPVENILILSL